MSDPLFGSMDIGDAAPLFGGDDGAFAALPGPFDDGDAITLDPDTTIDVGLMPWHGGAFAVVLAAAPAGTLVLCSNRGPFDTLTHTRLLRPDGATNLLVVGGRLPSSADRLVLSASDEHGVTHYPLRTAPAPFDRTLATLIVQAMARIDGEPDNPRNWQPLLRHLTTVSELAIRADVSLPLGPGIALVLDGDLGTTEGQPIAFALDGGQLTATRARLALDPRTGRSILVLPVIAARCFVMLDDGLVDVTCPPGATRSSIARAADAMALRASEGDLLLDLVAELSIDVGARVPDWLPIPHALGWRGSDGGSLAFVGAVPVEAGTIVFLAADDREHDLGKLMVRDVAHAAEPLFSVARPIAAFHPDGERLPDRLHLVLLVPRRLGAGALHVSLAAASDGGGWIRTLEPGAARTQAILLAWLPPSPADAAYARIVAASVRGSAARGPVVVAAETVTDRLRTAETVVLVIGFDAGVDAIEATLGSLPVTVRRSIPILIVLRSSDPGYDRIMEYLATTTTSQDVEIGTLVLAGPAGAVAAISAAFERLQATACVVLDAGARHVAPTGPRQTFPDARSVPSDAVVVAPGGEPPSGAVLSREAVRRWLGAVDGRLVTLPAVIADIARVAAEAGGDVVRLPGFALAPDPSRLDTFESLVDRVLLSDPRPGAAHRGTALWRSSPIRASSAKSFARAAPISSSPPGSTPFRRRWASRTSFT